VAGRKPPLLGVFALLLLTASCGSSGKNSVPAPSAATSEPGRSASTSAGAKVPSAQESPPGSAGPAPSDEGEPSGSWPAPKPSADEPPELTAIKARIIRGDRSTRTLKEIQKLSHKYAKNAEIAYILGQLYCSKLWMNDGLEAFRKAIRLEPAFRENPYLIKAAVDGLGNDGDHLKVEQFLVQEIGKPAEPFLEEVLEGNFRQQVKERASVIMQELQ